MMDAERPMCPSARCQPGAVLLGIVTLSGRTAYLRPAIRVSEELSGSWGSSHPETTHRFADSCIEGDCQNWAADSCLVARKVAAIGSSFSSSLPECSIRRECRWFRQEGASACLGCSFVITDALPSNTPQGSPSRGS